MGPHPGRILIADDNELARRLIKRLLQREGLDVCGEAADGQQAIDFVRDVHPDLIIMDFMMPVKDGLQAAREILAVQPDVRIVMNTLYLTEQLRAVAENVGIRRVVSKSDFRLLTEAVYAMLGAASNDSPVS